LGAFLFNSLWSLQYNFLNETKRNLHF